jgi:hypothetical protein
MSGGHFNDNGYIYHQVSQFAYELEEEIANNSKPDEYGYAKNYEPEVLEYLEEQVHYLHKMADIMRHIDYLYSGDHGSDTFMERVKEVENKYGSW